ncbi:MAG: hypothetical protein M3O66_06310 [Verrucomicrobiota bacterium]|nr:hypothetical protein [Verrucomicrobiota bacterium]
MPPRRFIANYAKPLLNNLFMPDISSTVKILLPRISHTPPYIPYRSFFQALDGKDGKPSIG